MARALFQGFARAVCESKKSKLSDDFKGLLAKCFNVKSSERVRRAGHKGSEES